MEWLKEARPFPYLRWSRLWIVISILVILAGFAGMFYNQRSIGEPFRLGIDFLGGTMLEVRFDEQVSSKEIAEIAAKYSTRDPLVQRVVGEENTYQIRIKVPVDPELSPEEQNAQHAEKMEQLKEDLTISLGENRVLSEETVGPTVSTELIRKAIIALVVGSFVILIYIFARFTSLVFAFGAIVALLHDVLITLGVSALARIEINGAFIAVILTIIGYSINDSIIIFDRIRENMRNFPTLRLRDVIDLSLTQTLVRSLNTSGTTLAVLLALFVFGGHTIRDFVAALMVGILAGTYSSIFIASPFVYAMRGEDEERTLTLAELAERMATRAQKAKKPERKARPEESRREARKKAKKKAKRREEERKLLEVKRVTEETGSAPGGEEEEDSPSG